MSQLLYYSNYCDNCKKLLQILNQTQTKKDIHFICIDQRMQNSDGSISILLKNGSKLVLPSTITKVPALLLPNHGFQVLFGEQIYQHIQPKEKSLMNKATQQQGEPSAFAFNGNLGCLGGNFGVSSDSYSYLDMNADDLSAKGSGGLRQLHNYVNIDHSNSVQIETPPDNYAPDKVNESEMQKYQQQRGGL